MKNPGRAFPGCPWVPGAPGGRTGLQIGAFYLRLAGASPIPMPGSNFLFPAIPAPSKPGLGRVTPCSPVLTSELLRLAARKAGVHLYTQTDCNVYANGPIVALHAAQDGPITLDTGRRGPVHDEMTGDLVGGGPCLALPMKKGQTRVFRY